MKLSSVSPTVIFNSLPLKKSGHLITRMIFAKKYKITHSQHHQTLPETSLDMSIRPTTGKSVHGSESEFSLTANSNKVAVVGKDNIYFTAPQMVASEINETNEMSGQKSFWNIITLNTTNTKLSPVLDTQRMSAFTITNRLNQPTSSNTPSFVADTASTGTSTAAVYCTKSIVLENSSTSLDIRLTSNVRSSSSVKVYFRIVGSEDDTTIDKVAWTPFNSDGSEDLTVTPGPAIWLDAA